MADRVAVFNAGRIEQLDTPRGLYTRPATAFVARFVGGANVVEGDLAARMSGQPQPFAVRAENVHVLGSAASPPAGAMHCPGTVIDVQYHGATCRWLVRLESGEMFAASAEASAESTFSAGTPVMLAWSRSDAVPLAQAPAHS